MSRPDFSSRKLRKLGYAKINQAIFAGWKEKSLAGGAAKGFDLGEDRNKAVAVEG